MENHFAPSMTGMIGYTLVSLSLQFTLFSLPLHRLVDVHGSRQAQVEPHALRIRLELRVKKLNNDFNLVGSCCYYPHFTERATEAKHGQLT